MAYVATFYSYKGGVGRTAALVNVAWALAEAGQRVLIVDTDLEAPGFEEYEELAGPDHPGFLELAEAFAASGRCGDLKEHLHRSPDAPNLWVMPAGVVDTRWAARVNALDWTALHPEHGTRRFVEALRTRIDEAVRPDYVLVDARTGFAEVAGVTTHLLADLVVLLFRQTRTSIRGTIQAWRSLNTQAAPVPALPVVSLVPPGQAAPGTLGARRIARVRELLGEDAPDLVRVDYDPAAMVAEGIPMRAPDLYPQATAGYRVLADRLRAANPADFGRARARGVDALAEHLRHFPSAVGFAELGVIQLAAARAVEAVAAWDRALEDPEAPVAWRFGRAEARLAVGDVDGAAADAEAAREVDPRRAAALAVRVAERRGEREEIAATRRAWREAAGGVTPAGERPSRALVVRLLGELPPRPGFDAGLFWDRLCGSAVIPREKQARLLEDLLDGGVEEGELAEVERVLGAERQSSVSFSGELGSELYERARRGSDLAVRKDGDSLTVGLDADYRLEAAASILPDTGTTYLPSNPQALVLREAQLRAALAVGDDLERAGRLTPGLLTNLGLVWKKAADLPDVDPTTAILGAIRRCRQAVALDPGNCAALTNLAGCLVDRYQGGDADPALLEEALTAMRQAGARQPNSREWLARLVSSALLLYWHSSQAERDALLAEARAACEEANRLSPGSEDYNLACALSLQGEHDLAEATLDRHLAHTPIPAAAARHALADRDLADLLAARPALAARLRDIAAG